MVSACALGLGSQASAAQQDVHALAAVVDAHYNRLHTLRTDFTESYSGMGQQRTEHGTLLLAKPGRMRWNYAGGKLFVLDGKTAVSYVPGDPQAQRMPAKQLDDLRSPLRFLLGHTRLEKELDGLHADPADGGMVLLTGRPRSSTGPESARIQTITVRVQPRSGTIAGLELREIDGTVTRFAFSNMEENIPLADSQFRFTAPPGVSILDALPPT